MPEDQEALRRIEEAERSGATNLDLHGLGLSEIPENLSKLTNLKRLVLEGNQIATLPENLSKLTNLRVLHLSDNQIATLPESLSKLTNLQYLSLWSNQIATLPESLSKLTNLQYFHLSNNQIDTLPESLSKLTNLLRLDLEDNQIVTLPESLSKLTTLRYLDLSDNQIAILPESFSRLVKLKHLFLDGNPLGIPAEILGPTTRQPGPWASPKAILDYYFSQREASRPLHEAKLILVGQGGVGKSSLVKTMLTGKFNPIEKPTPGIKIDDWSFPLGQDKIAIHIWDFGGQEMQHGTHRFFLTKRALYLLVLNRRAGAIDKEAYYWFEMIRSAGGEDAPVIVVLNKQKEEPFNVNREKWLEDYPDNIKGFIETDCNDPASIKLLQSKVEAEIAAMPGLNDRFPQRWFGIKTQLSEMQGGFISLQQYTDLCNAQKEPDPEKQAELAGHLHNLGIALNYGQNPRLRSHYVLKPEWVTEGIYALLHAPVTNGLLTNRQAEQTLKEKK